MRYCAVAILRTPLFHSISILFRFQTTDECETYSEEFIVVRNTTGTTPRLHFGNSQIDSSIAYDRCYSVHLAQGSGALEGVSAVLETAPSTTHAANLFQLVLIFTGDRWY